MQLGKLNIKVPLALAPMAGVTDLPYRVICKEQGCGFTISEMVSAKGLLYNNKKTFAMLEIDPKERPTAIQLFGSVPEELAKAAKIVEDSGADIIDFNMGCPVNKVVSNGEGSALMKKPELAYEILARMVEAVHIPVTVKFRSGWSEKNLNAPEIALLAQKAGVSAVSVHGRTREQFYMGDANWDIIRQVKQAVKIPVFGNGDIRSATDGLRMLEETGCDGLMVGRAADGNPWIFSELKSVLLGEKPPEKPTVEEKFAMMRRHLTMLIDFKGEKIALKEMRQHANAYVKGLPFATNFRGSFNQIETESDFLHVLEVYEEKLLQEDKNIL